MDLMEERHRLRTAAALEDKRRALEESLRDLGGVLVAYSGGVDSTFLAACAHRALGDRSLAVTVRMAAVPRRLLDAAGAVARDLGLRHEFLTCDPLELPRFRDNSPQRCYYCKKAILGRLLRLAAERGLAWVVEGSNADDLDDFRPGYRAVRECGIRSPLQEQGWTKDEIRTASRALGLPTADLPAAACLASRVPYGREITARKLAQIDAVEQALETHGLAPARARHHDDIVRIELGPDIDPAALFEPAVRRAVEAAAREAGFRFAVLDLAPYRSGRLNDALA
jgi:uncharacterized protein